MLLAQSGLTGISHLYILGYIPFLHRQSTCFHTSFQSQSAAWFIIDDFKYPITMCSEVSGDREVQRTMLELLNQLDGFSSDDSIKVC